MQTSDAQLDPNIAKCVTDGEADAIILADSDFAMCVGRNKYFFDLMIKDVHVNKKHLDMQS